MNLTVSPVNTNYHSNKTSFGMAKFSEKGYELASQHADIYTPLSQPNKVLNPEFFKKKGLIGRAPFTKYYIEKAKTSPEEVADTIIKCGATDNTHTNSMFIGQLLDTEKQIHKSDDKIKSHIGNAVAKVFEKNWDNPELSKKDTLRLLELAKYGMSDRAYISLTGVINLSEAK